MTPLQKIEDHSKDILTSAAQRVLPAGAADAPGSPPGSVISEQTSGGGPESCHRQNETCHITS